MSTPESNISRDLQDIFRQLLEHIEDSAGTEMGVSLCIFNTKPGTRINYISNVNRDDVVSCWKAITYGWEKGMPDIPAHKLQ